MSIPGSVGHRVPTIGGGGTSTPDTQPQTLADRERREMEQTMAEGARADAIADALPPLSIPATPVTYGPERASDHGVARSGPMAKGLGARASDWIRSTVGSRWSSRSTSSLAQAVAKSSIPSGGTGVPVTIDLESDSGEVHATDAAPAVPVPASPAIGSAVIEGDSGLSQLPLKRILT